MTQEALLIFDLDDVQAVKFQCKCGASQSFNPDTHFSVPQQCQQCGLGINQRDANSLQAFQSFVNALRQVRMLKLENVSLRLVLPNGTNPAQPKPVN